MQVLKRILRGSGILIAVVIVIFLGLWASLGWQGGRQTVATIINHVTADKNVKINLAGLQGNLLSDFTIATITISDKKGRWLVIDDIHVRWNPRLIAQRKQGIDVVSARKVVLSRLPEKVKQPADQSPAKLPDVERIASIVPKTLAITELEIASAIAGETRQLTISGKGALATYHLDAHNLTGTTTTLQADLGYDGSESRVQMNFAEAAQGLIGHLARLPADAATSGRIDFSSDKDVATLHDMALQLGTTLVASHGTMTLPDHVLHIETEFKIPDIAQYQSWASKPVAGDAHAFITAIGMPEKLQIDTHFDSNALMLGDHQLSMLDAVIPVTGDFTEIRSGSIDGRTHAVIKGILDGKPFDLDAGADLQDDTIKATLSSAHYDGYGVQGAGRLDRADGVFTLDLRSDWAALNKVMPKSKLNGNVMASLTATGDKNTAQADGRMIFETTRGNSTVDFIAEAHNGYHDFMADIVGDLRHDKTAFDVKTHVAGSPENITIDPLHVAGPGLAVDGKGQWQKTARIADANAIIDISDLAPLGALLGLDLHGSIKANAILAQEKGVQRADINVQKLTYRHDDLAIILAKPTLFRMVDKNAMLSPAVLAVAGGTATLQGSMSPDTVSGTADIRHIDLNRLAKTGLNSAVFDGKIALSGSPVSPVIDLRSDVTGRSGDLPVRASLSGNWRQNKLHLQADAKMRSVSAHLVSDLAASLSLKPFKTTLSKATVMNGNIAANVPLSEFNTMLWPRGHRVAGNFAGNAQLRGSIGTPQMLGRFVLDGFDYNNPASGICLNNAHAVIDGTTQQITLRDFTARDPRGGTFNASAQLTMAAPRPVNGLLAFRDFRLFCGGPATGTLDGQIGAKGSLQATAVAGRLRLGPLNVQIPAGRNTTNIPEVETRRIVPGAELPTALKPQSVVRLDVTLDAPSQVYVRGRGLDAEFGGNLHVGGTASAPDIRGAFASRRGRFTLLDRVMNLSRANLRFEGPIPPSPFLDVSAATDVNGTTITVNLTGSATKPDFTLISSPVKPQDEVLALLLFGRELKTISPFQAYQLAQATRELAGLDGGGPGILDRARGVLGVDTLDVGTDDDNNVTVSTGKYVTDKVYVGVQQGTTPESREVTTQIELSPSVTANTTLDADGNQGVGVGWKWDY